MKAIGEDLWMIPSELEIQDCEENEYKWVNGLDVRQTGPSRIG